ncbi:tagaturonate reductase [Gynuella sunshinyii]|nr:tagaturonate reductase [Gynuella sunshinyii]
MVTLNRSAFPGASYPEKIIQFGEGNFLRAFIDWQLDILNEHTPLNAGVTVVRPIDTDFPPSLNLQDGLYTTVIRGIDDQDEVVRQSRIIRSVNRELSIYADYAQVMEIARSAELKMVFSNTTEAGITYIETDRFEDAPPVSYPAKLTQFFYARYQHFNGMSDKGLVLFPCELIDYNGERLKEIMLQCATQWQLGEGFIDWLVTANTFCSTLVDRIVTGFPRSEHEELQQLLGYQDQFLDTAEYFYLFVIQGPQSVRQLLCLDQLPADVTMNILVVDDIKPYKERKVAILNGAHTAMVPVAYLAGIDTVGETMQDAQLFEFVEQTIFSEIIPTLDLPEDELVSFASDVLKRFGNPFIQHQLTAIALNSMTKFKTRILPQLLKYQQMNGQLPSRLVFSLAALLVFYRGLRGCETIPLQDDEHWLVSFKQLWTQPTDIPALVQEVLSLESHWELDLTTIPGLSEKVNTYINAILADGLRQALSAL